MRPALALLFVIVASPVRASDPVHVATLVVSRGGQEASIPMPLRRIP